MANYINIPIIWPFKMLPVVLGTPGIHFDDSWTFEQRKTWQSKTRYFQKWVKSEKTFLQIESSVAPDPLKILNVDRSIAKSINWVAKVVATGYTIYELEFDVTDLTTDRKYFNYQKIEGGPIKWEAISECIWVKDNWPETIAFKYKNSYNSQDVAWSTGIEMLFRCEAWISPLIEPKRVRSDYTNQKRNVETLSSVPYRIFKLYIGGTSQDIGVPPWVIDLMNRILSCDSVEMSGKKYQSDAGSEWEIGKTNTWSLMTGIIDIVESKAQNSLHFNDDTTAGKSILVVYQIKTKFFGGEQLVQVTDSETQ